MTSATSGGARAGRHVRGRYDLVILGGGSAGLSAAPLAAALGARVLLVDRERLGGECLYTGCVPSKALLHVAHAAAAIRRAGALGLSAHLDPVDLAAVADRVAAAIHHLEAGDDNPERFRRLGVEVAFGAARFISPSTLEINGHPITARRYLVCTGSRPRLPAMPGLAEIGALTNDSVFDLRRLPESLLVIGGGPTGVELGQAFARLGTRVTIAQRRDRILPREDSTASVALAAQLEADRVTIHTSAEAISARMRDRLKVVTVRTSLGEVELAAEEVLCAVGHTAHVAELGLDAAGVRLDVGGSIEVDSYLRTSNPHVFAAGDVIGGYHFTHAAAKEAFGAVRNALLPRPLWSKLDERVLPWATFTEPEVARVGLGEAEARERYGADIVVYTQPFSAVDRAVTDDATAGIVKLIATRRGKLLGAQIVGPRAGDCINELALALQHGMTLARLAASTHVYPTFALAIQQAAGQHTFRQAARSRLVRLARRLVR